MNDSEKKAGKSIAKYVLPPVLMAAVAFGAMGAAPSNANQQLHHDTLETCVSADGFKEPTCSPDYRRSVSVQPIIGFNDCWGAYAEASIGLGEILGDRPLQSELSVFANFSTLGYVLNRDLNKQFSLNPGFMGDAFGASWDLARFSSWNYEDGPHGVGIDVKWTGIVSMEGQDRNLYLTGSIGGRVFYPLIEAGVRATWLCGIAHINGGVDQHLYKFSNFESPAWEVYFGIPIPFKL